MADLTITAANVLRQAGSSIIVGTAGATITAGQAVYLNGSTYSLAKATTSATATMAGIALNSAATGQPISILTSGLITIGATVIVGGVYALSATSGGGFICPVADILTTGDYVTTIGIAPNATTIQVNLQVSGVAHA